jgi:hypothetical protein
MPPTFSVPDPPPARRRPLPVTITHGMPVVEIDDAMPATIVGITSAYCIYCIAETGTLSVAPWRNMALGNICPADALLPDDVTECDRGNAQATVLRELLTLRPFGLTASQAAVLDELVAQLCVGLPPTI